MLYAYILQILIELYINKNNFWRRKRDDSIKTLAMTKEDSFCKEDESLDLH